MSQNILNATKALYETIGSTSGHSSRDCPWDSPGYVEGSPNELRTFPGFLPVDSIEWPTAIIELRRSEEAHSQMGYFPTLQRAWLVVDSTFAMWNPFTGRDLQFFSELRNIIVAVGEPVVPKEGVFPSNIQYVIPIAGDDVLGFVGVQCRVHQGAVSEASLLDLDCFINTPCMITHISCCHPTSDIFAGGSNGVLYFVVFSSSMFGKSVKLVAAGGMIPIPGVNTFLRTLKTVVKGTDAAIMQVLCDQDEDRPLVYTLATDNTITLYAIENGGLKYITASLHNAANVQASTRVVSDEVSPLSSMYYVAKQGLVAVATSGERFIYIVTDSWISSEELSIRNYVASPLSGERIVTRSWCASNVFAISHVDSGDCRKPNQATLTSESSSPSVLTHLIPTIRDALRIEAICEVDVPTKQPESVAQLLTGPRQLIILHHTGMLVYAKLRPVEMLHLILLESAPVREKLLIQFFGAHPAADYCCMLIHLATARRSVRRGITVGMRGPTHNAAVYASPSVEVRRLAANLLRTLCTPTVHDTTSSNFSSQAGSREVIVTLSDFAAGVSAYLAFVSAPFWNKPVFGPNPDGAIVRHVELAHEAEMAMIDLQMFLESTNKELWGEPTFSDGAPVRWNRNRAHVSLKSTAVFSPHDRREIQNILLSAANSITQVVVQVHSFMSICARLHPEILGRIIKSLDTWKVTYADICTSQAKARALSRAVSREVASDRHVLDKEATLLLAEMESGSGFLFGATDKVEFGAVSQINAVLGAQSHAGIAEAVGQLCIVAGSIWRNGSLHTTISQLTSHGLEVEAIRVLFAAASQVSSSDPSARFPDLMEEITGLLEALYIRNTIAFQRLVGTPSTQGEMWRYAPQDTVTHRHLLAWLGATRRDTTLMDTMRGTLIHVPSSELEPFLLNATHQLGLLYVRYLFHIKRNADQAIQICSSLIQDPLTDMPSDQRLAFRISCAQEAAEISGHSNSPQKATIDHALKLLALQARVKTIVTSFLASGSPFLTEVVEGDDLHRTQREKAEHHLYEAENEVMTPQSIFMTAMSLDRFGGVDIALETAVLCHSSDSHIIGSLVERALCLSSDDFTAQEILRRYGGVAGFPLTVLIMVMEARAFLRSPSGSSDVPRILLASHVDAERAFAVYESLVEQRDGSVYPCGPYENAGVTPCFLLYSMAVLATASNYPRQESDIETLFHIERRLAATCSSHTDSAALEAALALVQYNRN